MYRVFKTTFEYESYLDIIPGKLRTYIVKLRVSVHPLKIQTGRYARNNIPRHERYCECCNLNDIEDEYHFVCICPTYLNIRNKFIQQYFYINPSVYKFAELLKVGKKVS